MKIVTADVLLDANQLPVLVRQKGKNYPLVKAFKNKCDVAKAMTEVFALDKQIAEKVYVIATDTKLKPIHFFFVNAGTVNSSLLDVRGIMMRMLLSNAAAFIVAHNHVSGETDPSKEDVTVTKALSAAANVMGITFSDHVIIGHNNRFYSFREEQPELFS